MDPEYREKYAWFSAAVRSRQAKPGDVGFTPLFWPRHPDRPLGLDEAFELADPALPQDRPDRPAPTVTGRGYDIDPTCNWDPSIRLHDMEVAGVDVSFIFPSQADGFCTLGDVGFESALHRSYHRFMSNYCADADGRLWWMGVLTMRDLPESIAQLEYWAKEDPTSRACTSRGPAPTGGCSTTLTSTRCTRRARTSTCPSGCTGAPTGPR